MWKHYNQKLYKCSDSEDFVFYIFIVIAAALVAILFILDYIFKFDILGLAPPCILRYMAGISCPVCGGTRAFYSLIRGDIISSVSYNPIVLYSGICIIPFFIGKTIYYFSHKKLCKKIHFMPIFIYIGLFILLINFFIKNAAVL